MRPGALRFATVDVFTAVRFGGNPLAVVLEADGLTTAEMQAVAREFGYSETSFVLRPADPSHDARVRIFTPTVEVPFAGHPNVGTAFVLAGEARWARAETLTFEEEAGLVRVAILREGGAATGARLTAPRPLAQGRAFDPAAVAACASLAAGDIATGTHAPRVATVGLPFVVAEVAARAALARARPDRAAFARHLPMGGEADAIYLWCRETEARDGGADLTARMFAPWDGVEEDPATGSATAAACALIAATEKTPVRAFRVAQGVDMGRPSRMEVRVEAGSVSIGGPCVAVTAGTIAV